MMKKYRDSIINIFKTYDVDPVNGKPGIRWAFEPIKNQTKFLILGINPSNSLRLVNSTIQKSAVRWSKGKFEEQLEYDLFLTNKENEKQITLLQDLAHEHHPHFQKHKKFLNPSINTLSENNQGFQFFDLFPVWRKDQKEFINELTELQKTESIYAFIELVDRHTNLDSLLFLNGSAGDFFMKEIVRLDKRKKKWDSIKNVNVGIPKKVKKAKFKLSQSNKEIVVFCFPIGEWGLTDYNLQKYGEIFNSKLANM